jgi:PIN domain
LHSSDHITGGARISEDSGEKCAAGDVEGFCARLGQAFTLLTAFLSVSSACRDPNDDMVLACAVAAEAQCLVTRDKDLLVLQQYESITIVTPEAFLEWLRSTLP